MTTWMLVLRYAAFAVLAMLCNLAVQRLALSFYDGTYALAPAVFVGTGVGLVVKYLLDKRWIFGDLSTGIAVHSRKISAYTLMGGVTTVIFWGTEATFWAIWHTDLMRELGAVLGLSIGYFIKYRLDKRYVFDCPGQVEGLA